VSIRPAPSTFGHPLPNRQVWLPITVRVAWELVLNGVKVRPRVLHDAREHVLRCLPSGVGGDEAERLATMLTRDYIERVRHGRYRRVTLEREDAIPVSRLWRKRLVTALDPVGDAVFRLHFGDGMSMELVEERTALPNTTLAAARDGVRETMRAILSREGVHPAEADPDRAQIDGDRWRNAKLDVLLTRVACLPEPGCPPPVGLLSDIGRSHADECPRCSRAVRLVRGGLLSMTDLLAPDEGLGPGATSAEVDFQTERMMALLIHPDARRHKKKLDRMLGDRVVPIGPDAYLVRSDHVEWVGLLLRQIAPLGTPPRHHLRGAVVEGGGRWSGGTLLGPLPILALELARARPWADFGSTLNLPPPLPRPPRATSWWASAGLAAAGALAAAIWVLSPQELPPEVPIEASFQRHNSHWNVRFDTDELAVMDVVVHRDGRLDIIHSSLMAEKGRFATGMGDYVVDLTGDGVALISSQAGIPELPALVRSAMADPMPLESLQERLRHIHPLADVVLSPAESVGELALR